MLSRCWSSHEENALAGLGDCFQSKSDWNNGLRRADSRRCPYLGALLKALVQSLHHEQGPDGIDVKVHPEPFRVKVAQLFIVLVSRH